MCADEAEIILPEELDLSVLFEVRGTATVPPKCILYWQFLNYWNIHCIQYDYIYLCAYICICMYAQ
jgi:hypothetical protein